MMTRATSYVSAKHFLTKINDSTILFLSNESMKAELIINSFPAVNI